MAPRKYWIQEDSGRKLKYYNRSVYDVCQPIAKILVSLIFNETNRYKLLAFRDEFRFSKF